MLHVESSGATVSYTKGGSGPALVLVHGSFSNHEMAWVTVRQALERNFTVYAVARRGRGETSKTTGHTISDEGDDIATVIDAIGAPVFLMGHSFGALCSLEAATKTEHIERLVLYEPPCTSAAPSEYFLHVDELAAAGEWGQIVDEFLAGVLELPPHFHEALKKTPYWRWMVDDAPATMGDFRAARAQPPSLDPARLRKITMPVLLLTGSESRQETYLTDDLHRMLPDSRIVIFEGQGHGATLTAPTDFVHELETFLLNSN